MEYKLIKYIIAFMIGAVLWRLGGIHWKWVRRYILPFFITIYAFMQKKKYKVLIVFPALVYAFSKGYGTNHPYWVKFLVGVGWIIPAVILGNWYALAVPFIWIILFKLSNTKPYANIFLWWVVEVLVGGMIGVSYANI